MIDKISKAIAFIIVLLLKVTIYPIYGLAMAMECISKFVVETSKNVLEKL